MSQSVNPAQLPSATKARFALLLTIVLTVAFAFSQEISLFSGEPEWSPQVRSLFNGAVGSLVALAASIGYYLIHPIFRARSFGVSQEVEQSHAIHQRISEICRGLAVATPRLLIDNDIRNYDALAFGLPWRKTVLMGRGLVLLQKTRPEDFDARIAHEIGHIRDGDIAAAFLAEGFVIIVAIFFLGSLAKWAWTISGLLADGWQRWMAAGATFSIFLRDWVGWIGFVLLMGLGELMVLVFWSGILWTEHRSFLRLREYYADNVAALAFGTQSIKNALGKGTDPSLRGFVYFWRRLSSAHPSVPRRKATIDEPVLLFEPTPARYGAMGYVVGLMLAVAFTIRDLPDPDAESMDALLTFGLTDPSGRILLVFLVLLFLPLALALGSLVLRTAIWLKLESSGFRHKTSRIFRAMFALWLGTILGGYLNPLLVAKLIHNPSNAMATLTEINSVVMGSIYTVQFAAALLASIFATSRLLTAPRTTAPGRTTWIILGITLYFSVGYLSGAAFALYDSDVAERGDTLSLTLAMVGIAFFWGLLGYLIARRTLRPGFQSSSIVAPWVYRESQLARPLTGTG